MSKIFELKSGVRVVYNQNTAVRSVAVGIFVGSGVVCEDENNNGISHFIEHMVFKGTDKRSAFDIVDEMDSIGANINAYTAKSLTCFYTVSLDEHFEQCLDVLADMYFNPKFAKKDLDMERGVVIEEINESFDDPDDVCEENLSKVFFDGNPLSKTILGPKECLEKMTSKTLKDHHKKYYVPRNTVISVCGNIEEERLLKAIDKYFESQAKDIPFEGLNIETSKPNCKASVTIRDIAQAHISIAFPHPVVAGNEKLGATANVLSLIFGGGMSSRLFQNIREKLGVCYSIYCGVNQYRGNGSFEIVLGTSTELVEKAIKAIRNEIDKFIKEGVTQKELDKAKEQVKTSLIIGNESTNGRMRLFGAMVLVTGSAPDFDAKLAAIDTVTSDDVVALAKEIFDFDKVCTSLVAPEDIDILSLIRKKK